MVNPAGVRRDFEALEKRRFQAIRLLDKRLNQSEVARRVKVVRQTVTRWVSQYRQQGAESLKSWPGRRLALQNRDDVCFPKCDFRIGLSDGVQKSLIEIVCQDHDEIAATLKVRDALPLAIDGYIEQVP